MTAKSLDTSAATEARRLVNELLRMETMGHGDMERAMRRLGRRYGLNWRVFWNLRYRQPRDVFVGVFEQLKSAYRAECRRQLERLQHELQIAQIKGVPVDDIADEVSRLVAQCDEEGGQ